MFQIVLLSLLPPGNHERADDDSPVISVGIVAWDHSELRRRVDATVSDKLWGAGYSADILLIHGEVIGLDSMSVVELLLGAAVRRDAGKSYSQVWYLSPHWTGTEKLYKIV